MSQASQATILLVDDDPLVREVTGAMLEDLGYDVVEADSGAAALDLLAKGTRLDLMMVDCFMPGMSGLQLAQEALGRRPGMPVLFVTGAADDNALAEFGADRIVLKPFRNEDLARKVRVALAGPDNGQVVSFRR